MKINYSKLAHVPSRTFSSFSILSHFRVCTKTHKKRSSWHRLGWGRASQGWAPRVQNHTQHECSREWPLLPLPLPDAAGEGCNWALKCRESSRCSVSTCSYFWRQVPHRGSSFLQVLPSSSSGHGSLSEPSGSHQLLTAIKVWVSSQCLCCAWSYAAFTERKKPNQN